MSRKLPAELREHLEELFEYVQWSTGHPSAMIYVPEEDLDHIRYGEDPATEIDEKETVEGLLSDELIDILTSIYEYIDEE